MARNRAKQRSDKLFLNLEMMAASGREADGADEDTSSVLAIQGQAVTPYADSSKLPRMKKFRFQLLHQWLVHQLEPCKAADIGGGKGLLGYLLQTSGWE